MNEVDFRRQLVGERGLADRLGWQHMGIRPAMTEDGWRTAGTGQLLKGWPDLTLVHPRSGRLVFAELKSTTGALRDDQRRVLDVLHAVEVATSGVVSVHVWRPDDFDVAAVVLAHGS